jgi:hypothetical protein
VLNRPGDLRGGRLRHGDGFPLVVLVLLLIEVLSFAVVAAVPAAAAAPAPGGQGPVPRGKGVAMSVSPPRLTVAPRQVISTQRLQVANTGSVRLNVHAQVQKLAQAKNGSSLPQANAPASDVGWVTVVPSHFFVPPGTSQRILVRIRIPPHPEPGDHDLAILFMVPPVPGKGNIHISAGIGIPVLIAVPGRVIDHVGVTSLHTQGFSMGGNIPLAATVRESGDVHHSFRGPRNRLVAQVGETAVLFPPITVLRGSTITLNTKWTDHPVMCVCHVKVAVFSDGRRSMAAATVVIFPVVQVLSGIGAIVALLAAFLLARRYQRSKLTAAYEAGRRHKAIDGQPSPG